MDTGRSLHKIVANIWIVTIALTLIVAYAFGVEEQFFVNKFSYYVFEAMLIYLYFITGRTVVLLSLSFYERLVKRSAMEIENFPLVTIIIPCFNEGKVIQHAIQSVEKLDYPNLEILVVDDGSTDDTFVQASEMSKTGKVRVVTKTNGGKASALNHGIEEAVGDYILCMDADSHLNRKVLQYAMPYFIAFPQICAVAGNVRVGNVTTPVTLFQKLEYVVGLNFHKMAQSAINAVTIIPGPIGVFKREALLEVGGYETKTFAEDCDLTLKLLAAGHSIKYHPDVVAYTEAPVTIYQLIAQRYRWSRGTIQAIFKNGRRFFKGENKWRKIFIFFYIVIETMIIPTVNFLFFMITMAIALQTGTDNLYGPFFFGLTLMDATIALYSIFTEKEMRTLFFLSIIGRITYGLSLEILRFFAMLDELLNIPMKWGEQIRQGMK